MTQYIGKCAAGHVVRGTQDDYYGGWLRCSCGREAIARTFKGTFSEKKCGGRCANAVTDSCSCSCGGEHHGENKVFVA